MALFGVRLVGFSCVVFLTYGVTSVWIICYLLKGGRLVVVIGLVLSSVSVIRSTRSVC